MPLRFLLTFLLHCTALIAFAQTDVYSLRRDSILHAPKMQAVFKRDSLLSTPDYFMRKNQVRVMIETEGNDVDSLFYTVWGALERRVSYTNNRLWFVDTYEYNAFGDLTKSVFLFYYNGQLESNSTRRFYYSVQADSLSELLMKMETITLRFEEEQSERTDSTATIYEYDRNNRLVMTTRSGPHDMCDTAMHAYTETVTYSYDKRGNNRKQVLEKKGACTIPSETVTEISYNGSHQVIKETVLNGDDTLSHAEWTIGTNGRSNLYTNKDFVSNTLRVYESYYLRNGLESQYTMMRGDEKKVTRYTYIYYAGDGTPVKKKKRSSK